MNKFLRNLQRVITKAISVMSILCILTLNVYAEGGGITPPANVDTSMMDSLIAIVFWIVRIAVVVIGAIPALVKIVQGQANEDPRERNGGIAVLVISGAVFAATFAIEALI